MEIKTIDILRVIELAETIKSVLNKSLESTDNSGVQPQSVFKIDSKFILVFVSQNLGVNIKSKVRSRDHVWGRMAYAYLCRSYTNESLAKIGGKVGKDHATILHYLRKHRHLLTDKLYCSKILPCIKEFEEKMKNYESK